MKNLYALLIVIALVLSSSGIGAAPIFQINDKFIPKTYLEGNQFHGITSGNNTNWYIVKFSSSSTIHIEDLYIKTFYTCKNARDDVHGFLLTNFTDESYYWMHQVRKFNKTDIFFHMNVGQFNYTYDHLSRGNYSTGGAWDFWNITLSPGTWYLMCLAAETVECKIEVWINTSEKVAFLNTSEGATTFLCPSEEFGGNLNVKFPHIMGIINGEKTVGINNTFVGFYFFDFLGSGMGILQYTDPDGNVKKAILFQVGNLFSSTGDFDASDFIIGKGGMWKFKVNVIAIGKIGKKVPISFSMFGADVKLP